MFWNFTFYFHKVQHSVVFMELYSTIKIAGNVMKTFILKWHPHNLFYNYPWYLSTYEYLLKIKRHHVKIRNDSNKLIQYHLGHFKRNVLNKVAECQQLAITDNGICRAKLDPVINCWDRWQSWWLKTIHSLWCLNCADLKANRRSFQDFHIHRIRIGERNCNAHSR